MGQCIPGFPSKFPLLHSPQPNLATFSFQPFPTRVLLPQDLHRMVEVGRESWRSSSPTSLTSRVTYSILHRITSNRVLNISRDGDSTASLSSLFQCSVTLMVKETCLCKAMMVWCQPLGQGCAPVHCHNAAFGPMQDLFCPRRSGKALASFGNRSAQAGRRK